MARVIDTKKTKTRQVVDRSLRHSPIRTALANTREFVSNMEANPLKKPAQLCLSRLAAATSILEQTSQRFDSELRGLLQLKPEWERSASEAMGGRQFITSGDAVSFRKDYIDRREKETRDRIAKSVAEKFNEQAGWAAEKAVAALQEYDKEITRQRVIYTGLLPAHQNVGNASIDQIGFQRMKLEAASWNWPRKLGYLIDCMMLFPDSDPQWQIAELIILEQANAWEANPPPFKPGTDRTGKHDEDRRCVAKSKALIEERRASRVPNWLKYHERIALPAIHVIFKNVCGLDLRTMSASDLARWSKNQNRKPTDVMDGWQGRYCLPDARALLSRNFTLESKWKVDDTPSLAEALEEQRKKQPKKAG